VPVWLSEEWVSFSGELIAASPRPAGDATGVVAVEVSGSGGGSYWRRWTSGVPAGNGVGKPDEPADLTLGLTVAEARAYWRGEWSPSVAYMRGQLKTAGNGALLLALLAASAGPEWAGICQAVEAATSLG
jgi:hypothetical protein